MEDSRNLACDTDQFEAAEMQKEAILNKLRDMKFRITKQRLLLLDIILDGNCSCCKEIYYQAVKVDSKIGAATVYRMVNTLEEIGAISRKNIYRITCDEKCKRRENICTVRFEDETELRLSENTLKQVVLMGLKTCGYVDNQKLKSVEMA